MSVIATVRVSGAKPLAVAVICTEPGAIPVTCGFADGICRPAGMKMLGVIVATDGSLLDNETVTPPAGAGMPMLNASPDV